MKKHRPYHHPRMNKSMVFASKRPRRRQPVKPRAPRITLRGTVAVRGLLTFIGGWPLHEVLAAIEGKNVRVTFQVIP